MKITAVEATWVRIALKKPFTAFYTTYVDSSHLLVRLHTDDGVIGIAEAPCHQPPEAMLHVLVEYLAPAVIGADPRQMDQLHETMDARLRGIMGGDSPPVGHNATKYAIDQAAYDAVGKAWNMPVASLLGGKYRDAVPVCDVIGILEPEEVKQAARSLLDRGFKQVKLKAGIDFQRDLDTVNAVKAACGDGLQIRLDINTGYKTAAVALPLCRRLEEAGVDIFEQPVASGDLEGMAEMTAALAAPVLAHESLATVEDAVTIMEMRAADLLNVSPPRAGGLYPTIQMVRWAELMNFPVMIAGGMETGPGNIASAHLGAACREQPFPGDARTVLRESETLIREPIELDAGLIHLPAGPGLGVSFDDAAIARCQQAPWRTVE